MEDLYPKDNCSVELARIDQSIDSHSVKKKNFLNL